MKYHSIHFVESFKVILVLSKILVNCCIHSHRKGLINFCVCADYELRGNELEIKLYVACDCCFCGFKQENVLECASLSPSPPGSKIVLLSLILIFVLLLLFVKALPDVKGRCLKNVLGRRVHFLMQSVLCQKYNSTLNMGGDSSARNEICF